MTAKTARITVKILDEGGESVEISPKIPKDMERETVSAILSIVARLFYSGSIKVPAGGSDDMEGIVVRAAADTIKAMLSGARGVPNGWEFARTEPPPEVKKIADSINNMRAFAISLAKGPDAQRDVDLAWKQGIALAMRGM
jgi:hypothetical protein